MIGSNPKYESISLASNKNLTLCCQKFQNIRFKHIVQNHAKFHEKNSLSIQRFSVVNRDTTFINARNL